jgi:hypothetical protein
MRVFRNRDEAVMLVESGSGLIDGIDDDDAWGDRAAKNARG